MALCEVDFSEMGEAEAAHSRDPRKINLGEEILGGNLQSGRQNFRTA